MIGDMSMPADFEYRDVFEKGQPAHLWYDRFRIRHPAMDCGRRAKIFAPFDALSGFSDAVSAKETPYEYRRELSDGEKDELDRRLGILHRLTANSRLARENRVFVSVTHYVPCADRDSFSYGYRGQYVTVTGMVRRVDARSLRVDETEIPLEDLFAVETTKTVEGRSIFAVQEEDGLWAEA